MLDGDLGAIKYLLSTKGKTRGYVEKQEMELSGGVSIVRLPVKAQTKEEWEQSQKADNE